MDLFLFVAYWELLYLSWEPDKKKLCQTEIEVEQLNLLKAGKMRELVLKRQTELEEIYRGVHVDVDSDAARKMLINLIDSGLLIFYLTVECHFCLDRTLLHFELYCSSLCFHK